MQEDNNLNFMSTENNIENSLSKKNQIDEQSLTNNDQLSKTNEIYKQLDFYKKRMEDLQNILRGLDPNFSEKNSDLQIAPPNITKDQAQPFLQNIQNELDETKNRLIQTIQQLDSTNSQLHTTQNDLVQKTHELESINGQLHASQTHLEQKTHELESINGQLVNKAQEVEVFKEQLGVKAQELQSNTSELESIKNQLGESVSREQNIKEQHNIQEQKLESVKTKLEAKVQELELIVLEKETLKTHELNLKNKIESLEKEQVQNQNRSDQNMNVLITKNEELVKSIEKLKEELKEKDKSNKFLSKAYKKTKKNEKRYRDDNEIEQFKAEVYIGKNEELEKTLLETEAFLEGFKVENKDLEKVLFDSKETLNQLKEELNKSSETTKALSNERLTLLTKLDEIKNTFQTEKYSLHQQNTELLEKIKSKETSYKADLKLANNRIGGIVENINNSHKEYIEKINTLKDNNKVEKEELIVEFKKLNESYRDKFNAFQERLKSEQNEFIGMIKEEIHHQNDSLSKLFTLNHHLLTKNKEMEVRLNELSTSSSTMLGWYLTMPFRFLISLVKGEPFFLKPRYDHIPEGDLGQFDLQLLEQPNLLAEDNSILNVEGNTFFNENYQFVEDIDFYEKFDAVGGQYLQSKEITYTVEVNYADNELLILRGWAFGNNSPLKKIEVYDESDRFLGFAEYGIDRGDVAASIGVDSSIGFKFIKLRNEISNKVILRFINEDRFYFEVEQYLDSKQVDYLKEEHNQDIIEDGFLVKSGITKEDLKQTSVYRGLIREVITPNYVLNNENKRKTAHIDSLMFHSDSAGSRRNVLCLRGWCLSKSSGIKDIEVFNNSFQFLGRADYGSKRPDVGNAYLNVENSKESGFSLYLKLDTIPPLVYYKIILKNDPDNPVFISQEINDEFVIGELNTQSQYEIFMLQNKLSNDDIQIIKNNCESFVQKPKISIVTPVYNVDPIWLDKCFESVLGQYYQNWEFCLYDDCSTNQLTIDALRKWEKVDERIKVGFGTENLNISLATNGAIAMATGDFVGLLDNDDELTPDALYEMVKALNNDPELDIIYSDEDKMEMDGQRTTPYFKPDFSLDLLLSNNYICHFTVIRKAIGDKIGWFRKDCEGAQDHDIILRLIDKTIPEKIHHIPKVLYHWRKIPGSTAEKYSEKSYVFDAGKKAVNDYLIRNNIKGTVEEGLWEGSYRVKREIVAPKKVSIIIPFNDKVYLLKMLLKSIFKHTSYENYEIILLSNNSKEKATFDFVNNMVAKKPNVTFLEYNIAFNYSKLNNWAVDQCDGEYLLFLNNDMEVISQNWLSSMVEHIQREEVGAVGAKLYYPDDTLQHGGVIVGLGGVAGHSHKGYHRNDPGHFFRLKMIQNLSACTAACLLVTRDIFKKINGFNEDNLKVAFNDIDLCLKIREQGALIVFTPYTELYHYESKSRGFENTPEKQSRFESEIKYFKERWGEFLKAGDPYYSPNLTLDTEDFSINV